ncbi:MAG TPA: TIR domain-containing protein [Blastocatellia bacterium]|nr:TIR domain-containing protein [Blastocatellia bacterium]
MRVFLSWSGQTSRDVASALHDWLPYVIQTVKPFVSTGDIEKGKRWSEQLAEELNEVAYGIVCITQDNHREPWINFEAGAISKALEKSCVSPFLFNVDPEHIQGPLQQFQSTVYDKEDIFTLLRSMNSRLETEDQLSFEILRREFDTWWPDLKSKLDDVLAHQEIRTHTGFDWLYTTDDLAKKTQANVDSKSIWVVSPDLYRNALTPTVRDVMQRNIESGVSYEFIIPTSDEMDIAKEGLKRIAVLKPDQVHINEIAESEFRSVAVTDYVIVNPDSTSTQVFLELPTTSPGYWIEVDNEAATKFVVRFRKLVDKK